MAKFSGPWLASLPFVFLVGKLFLAGAQTPDEAAALAVLAYTNEILPELEADADSEFRQQQALMPSAVENSSILLGIDLMEEENRTFQAVEEERQREGALVEQMASTVEQARAEGIREVENETSVWARGQAQADIYEAIQSELNNALEASRLADNARQNATAQTNLANDAYGELVQLAREAEAVGQIFNNSHILLRGYALEDRMNATRDLAAYEMTHVPLATDAAAQARVLAEDALQRANVANDEAVQSLKNAQTNARNLQRLKFRAQSALQATRPTLPPLHTR
uniref:Uncharacterized protein n=1 Tax=Zooxanthella nutricula TaxID=1333877 RepID=A0A7S2KIH7_9DINO